MNFEELIAAGWSNHESDPEGVFKSALEGVKLIEKPDHAAQLGRLLFHVGAEHLARADEVLKALTGIRQAGHAPAGSAEAGVLTRLIAAGHLCAGDPSAAERELGSQGADLGIARAMAATVHAAQGHVRTAHDLLRGALTIAASTPHVPKELARVLAVTGNNVAAELEEEHDLDDASASLMLEAATVGRKYWEMAGDWQNVERAEYRLASAYCRLGRGVEALAHARECLSVCETNSADAGELFFAHEILARAHAAAGSGAVASEYCLAAARWMERVTDPGLRDFCQQSLTTLRSRLSGA